MNKGVSKPFFRRSLKWIWTVAVILFYLFSYHSSALSTYSALDIDQTINHSSSSKIDAASYASKPVHFQTLSSAAQDQKQPTPKQPKTVYLTFDDGPSKNTPEVLNILKEEKVPATFFVLGEQSKQSPELISRIVNEGHAIGNHTYNHEYSQLYQNFVSFWNQIKQTEEVINDIVGIRPQLIRAPGGTYGHFDQTYFDLLEKGGYHVVDWNVDSGDSTRKNVPAKEIISNVEKAKLNDRMIVLMHDGAGHNETVKALPQIISFYRDHGYTFKTLTPEDEPLHFSVHVESKWSHRIAPGTAWIESHVDVNAELFHPGTVLALEVGRMQTELKSGEYRIENNKYMVPLRTLMEKLGAEVYWQGQERQVTISQEPYLLVVDLKKSLLQIVRPESKASSIQISISIRNDKVWVPLREVLQSTGHPIQEVTMDNDKRGIKTL
ncbi:polysaccharide deacetylase [Paenibacillus sediminis]|uniref:Peptidoglycan/xylan/chitin deacetylase (PgdA/CDA1 family) n=1 Tax=Paenibacillus sediminis TaxID=664909 RepID=A0ABS4H674_9BACL|nr:polysaccharide deacetylase [Paenibacillus sediminis]MBP1937991.1 peptidoglycan/xylan/chitin deacetylase (PgdA/CDA1 family) [Paenibacillus sediminis]